MSNLFNELKRRNVFRVGIAYLVVGWVMIEVVDTIASRMGATGYMRFFRKQSFMVNNADVFSIDAFDEGATE